MSTPAAPPPEPYASKLTLAEFDAIIAIEKMMRNGCSGMFANDGTSLTPELAKAMETAGLLESQWMPAHPDYPGDGDGDDERLAYWPTASGRFHRGMVVVGRQHGHEIVFRESGS